MAGHPAPFRDRGCQSAHSLFAKGGLGWSQFNEVMILLGYDRVSAPFFQYLVNQTCQYQLGAAIDSTLRLREAVDRFRRLAMLRFGNIKFAFKILSALNEQDLANELAIVAPLDDAVYKARHEPAQPIDPIPGDETYYLGYLVGAEIDERLRKNPSDTAALKDKSKRDDLIGKGIRNHEAYLASDHMDVYVATSMRERHEYFIVNKITEKIFADDRLKELKLRWFDPTQAYCQDRIDKGLAEALMLKRARCTLYFVQETDTLGKDSELASTLAQGKPVIAFIPKLKSAGELKWLLQAAKKMYPGRTIDDVIRQQFELVAPRSAWSDPWVQEWIRDPTSKTYAQIEQKLFEVVRTLYDKRAETLKETHPLGIQVNLETGVANGLLVARTTSDCADLLYRVLTNRLEFKIDVKVVDDRDYLLLRESITNSVFRVVTGDPLLTNAFWNFYLT